MFSSYPQPTLKPTVDAQVRKAFHDGNWQQAARLAEKKAKALKDPYYQAVAIAAESQLDSPQEKCAALVVLESCLESGAVIHDGEILDLYEWACQHLLDESRYSETHGQLRLRLVKAAPRNKAAVMHSLRLCLLHWDLVNAQQIAAVLDKTFVSDRQYLFWNILLTFMLSTSPQCPPSKKDLYSLLALRQIERAADLREKGDKSDRKIRTEEEQLLYFRVLAAQPSPDALLRRLKSPVLGGVASFEQGRKHLFLDTLHALETEGDRQALFQICKSVLGSRSKDGSLNLLGSDLAVWRRFIASAAHQEDEEEAFAQVRDTLKSYLDELNTLPPVYTRIVSLAIMETAFKMPRSLNLSDEDSMTARLAQMGSYIGQNFDKLACFDDLKQYAEQLSFPETKSLIQNSIPGLKTGDTKKDSLLDIISFKIRYFLLSSVESSSYSPIFEHEDSPATRVCKWCHARSSSVCHSCVRQVVIESLRLKRGLAKAPDAAGDFKGEVVDPAEEVTLVATMGLLKLSGLRQHAESPVSPLLDVRVHYFLQAVAILDTYLSKCPDRAPERMLLVHLYLLLGCASHAYQLWLPLDVKRTIQDSLSPLFFDRVASVGPGLFRTGPGFQSIVKPMKSYYANCLKLRAPTVLWDALEAGSYTSVLDISEYMQGLRHSCTLTMAIIEQRQGERSMQGKVDMEIRQTPHLAGINPSTKLSAKTDYGSLPNLESPTAVPLSEVIRLGPKLSDLRSHLQILSERFQDLVAYTPPKEYKPSKASETHNKDKAFIIEISEQLHQSMIDILHLKDISSSLTAAEENYFTTISLLAALVPCVLSKTSKDAAPTEEMSLLLENLLATTSIGVEDFETVSPAAPNFAFLAFGSLHSMSNFLWSVQAVKHTVVFLREFNEKQLALDKTGKSGVPKAVLKELKPLEDAAEGALKAVKERIKGMKSALDETGWMDRLAGWTFGPVAVDMEEDELKVLGDWGEKDREIAESVYEAIGEMTGCETWGVKILESWREGVKGWGMIKVD